MPFDLKFSEEQEVFRKTCREFCEKNVLPKSKEMFRSRMLIPEVHSELVRQGLLSLLIPTSYGGQGADFISFIIAIEEFGKADLSVNGSFALGYHNTCALTLHRFGNDKLREEVIPRIVRDGWMVDIHSTEPGCGTDFTAITTRAEKKGGGYIINGEKQCVSLIPEIMTYGGGFMVTTKTAPELGGRGMTVFFVPYNAKGITTTRFEGMGVDIGGAKYENVEVPEHYIVGRENGGYTVTNESFIFSRIPVTMCMVAAAMKCLEIGIDYVRRREAFGRPIGAFEGIQFELADDLAHLEAARLLTYRAAWMADKYLRGEAKIDDLAYAVAEAKLFASKYAVEAIHHTLEWCGALGLTTEFDLQMAYRGARMMTVAEGTMNAMRIIIALQALGREYVPWRWGPPKK